ncbi:hypothetical protein SAY87_018076 [Trapa incisa]|uniref:Uncharacterized protein n=1 Tax=Trapa incisa TaxID=236973 RepID=A0AAN7QSG4_9MYRT|nr:hypothetical protein SAY87_018076 [Trapa incisa]
MSAMKTHVGRGRDDGDETTERESSVGLRPDPFPRTAVAGGNMAGSGLDSRLTVYRWGNTIIHSGRSLKQKTVENDDGDGDNDDDER